MSNQQPIQVLDAVRRRRYLISWWPWRSLAYLVSTGPAAIVGWTGALAVALPWTTAAGRITRGQPVGAVAVHGVILTAVTVLFWPFVAMAVGAVERRRLRIVDDRPLGSGHGPVPGGALRGLPARLAEAATWRESAYLLIVGVVVPLVQAGVAVLLLLEVVLLAGPWLAGGGRGPVSLGIVQVDTAAASVPYLVLGVVLLPVVLYVPAVVAAGQAAVARVLLGPGSASTMEVEQSRSRLVTAYEAERRRIERDLHDGVQHRLASLTVHLGLARLDLPEGSPAAASVATAHEQAKDLMRVLRDVVHGVRPQTLTDLGLPGALRELAGAQPVPTVVTVAPDVPDRLPEPVEITGWFVASEALTNVTRHSGATRVEVALRRERGRIVLEVRDDGRGGASPSGGTGLTGLADRVAAVGGRLLLTSPAGGPTVVRMEVPWAG